MGGVSSPPTARSFPLDEVLTVSMGLLLARRGMEAVYDVLNFLTGDSLFTHQLPRALKACGPAVLAQHPDLASITDPEFGDDVQAELPAWLETVEAQHGTTRLLVPVAEWEHRNPVEELCDLVGPERVYVYPEATDG